MVYNLMACEETPGKRYFDGLLSFLALTLQHAKANIKNIFSLYY